MNWNWLYEQLPADLEKRGRPGPRLLRGVLWAALAIFVMSVLTFIWRYIWIQELLEYFRDW